MPACAVPIVDKAVIRPIKPVSTTLGIQAARRCGHRETLVDFIKFCLQQRSSADDVPPP
jgi:hypothetical protein